MNRYAGRKVNSVKGWRIILVVCALLWSGTDAFALRCVRPEVTSENPCTGDSHHGVSRARYYSARRGRFITKDPTTGKDGDSQSLNRYVYALNNPLRLIDISGLSAQEASTRVSLNGSSDGINDGLVQSGAVGQWETFRINGFSYRARRIKTDSQLTMLEWERVILRDNLLIITRLPFLLPSTGTEGAFGFFNLFIPDDPRYEVDRSSFFFMPLGNFNTEING